MLGCHLYINSWAPMGMQKASKKRESTPEARGCCASYGDAACLQGASGFALHSPHHTQCNHCALSALGSLRTQCPVLCHNSALSAQCTRVFKVLCALSAQCTQVCSDLSAQCMHCCRDRSVNTSKCTVNEKVVRINALSA